MGILTTSLLSFRIDILLFKYQCSYLIKKYIVLVKVGVVVMIVHDISDIFLSIGRSYGDMRHSNKYIVYFTYVMIYFSWFWARIYVFPTCVINETL